MDYKEKQRLYRVRTDNAATKKYERTKKGKLMRMYRNMQSRVNGVQKKGLHLYNGKPLLPRDEFYRWAMASVDFHELFREWEGSGYDRKLAPTVDRIDPLGGYVINNMQWLTHSENSRRGGQWKPSDKEASPTQNQSFIRTTP